MIPYQAFDRRRPQKTLRGKCLTSSSSLARAHLLEARRSRAAGKCRREKGLSRHPAWAWAGAEPLQVDVSAFRPRGECDGEVLGECELSVEQEKDVRRRGPRTEAWASSVLVQGGSYSVYDSLKDCVVPYDHRTRPNWTLCCLGLTPSTSNRLPGSSKDCPRQGLAWEQHPLPRTVYKPSLSFLLGKEPARSLTLGHSRGPPTATPRAFPSCHSLYVQIL